MKLKRNLDELIYNKLVDNIIAAEWHAGEIISIDDITNRYEVSRTPVVQAIKKMQSEELVEMLPNGRVRFPESTPEQIRDVCQVRIMIEETVGKIICEESVELDIPALKNVIEACKRYREEGNYLESGQMDRTFHRMLVEAAGNGYLNVLYGLVQKKFLTINYLNRPSDSVVTEEAAEMHFQMLDRIEKKDYEEYCRLVRKHLEAVQKNFDSK